jgi:hypothetical protein
MSTLNPLIIENMKKTSATIVGADNEIEYLRESVKNIRAQRRLAVKQLNSSIKRYPAEAVAAEVQLIVKEEEVAETPAAEAPVAAE